MIPGQPESIPVAGLGPANLRLRCGDCRCLKTWVPGTSPGKGLLEAKFGITRSSKLPLSFPRTALRFRGKGELISENHFGLGFASLPSLAKIVADIGSNEPCPLERGRLMMLGRSIS